MDHEEALARLREQGLLPIAVQARRSLADVLAGLRPVRGGAGGAVLWHELATLLGAGERLDGALALIAEELDDARLARALRELRERIRAGRSFADALAATPELADRELIAMVAVGEASGRLAEVLADLARVRSRREEFARRWRGALIYPLVLSVASLFAVLFVLIGVVPRFASLVAGREETLPGFARFVFTLSQLLREAGDLLALGLLLLLLAGLAVVRIGALRRRSDALLLSLPLLSRPVRERVAAEFTRALAVLGKGGVDLPRAVTLAAGAVSNLAAREALMAAASRLREGRTLAATLAAAALLPRTALRLLRAGEESGRLSDIAAFLAGHYESRLEQRATQLVRIIEPVLIVLLGVVVAGIVGAVMSALLTLQRLAI
jgi:general secretion pathway protein F